jgi:ATP-dependent DNA ligase
LIKPMLAVQGRAFSRKDWIFEAKIDGARCIAYISANNVELQNRRLKTITYRYPEVIRSLKQAVAGDCILDGEMAVFSKRVPSFSSLAEREQQLPTKKLRIDYLSKALPASYIVFDILYKDGESQMGRPLLERKLILKASLKEDGLVTIIDYLQEEGEAYFKAALKSGWKVSWPKGWLPLISQECAAKTGSRSRSS